MFGFKPALSYKQAQGGSQQSISTDKIILCTIKHPNNNKPAVASFFTYITCSWINTPYVCSSVVDNSSGQVIGLPGSR